MKNAKLDQSFYQSKLSWLQQHGATLAKAVEQRTGEKLASPQLTEDLIQSVSTMDDWCKMLEAKLPEGHIARARFTEPQPESSAEATFTGSVMEAALSMPDVGLLAWTERCQLAGGHLSMQDARSRIDERKNKKAVNKPTLTEQCRAARNAVMEGK